MTETTEIAADADSIAEALATGVASIETARRVGWAKAFDAIRRVEALEEEVRQLRAERTSLRRAYSRLVGFITNVPITKSPVLDAEVAAHNAADRSFRHLDAWEKGAAVARQHQALVEEWDETDRRVKADKYRLYTEELALLRRQSVDLGHSIREHPVGSDEFDMACSCGEGAAGLSHSQSRKWRLEHDAQVVHGVTYTAFRRGAKKRVHDRVKEQVAAEQDKL